MFRLHLLKALLVHAARYLIEYPSPLYAFVPSSDAGVVPTTFKEFHRRLHVLLLELAEEVVDLLRCHSHNGLEIVVLSVANK